MNLERLRAVQAAEREADSLRPLPDDFYREVADYLGELRAERKRAADAAADPFGSEEVRRLTDEIETAEEVAEAIYERRVGKLVKRATLAASGMNADEEGLTDEEAELFAEIVEGIEAHRSSLLADFGGGASGSDTEPLEGAAETEPPVDDDAEGDADTDPDEGSALDAGAAMGEEDAGSGGQEPPPSREDPPAEAPPADDPPERPPADHADEGVEDEPEVPDREATGDGAADERVTLRITREVGEVFGVDERTYDLGAEDVVTLPAANAKPLLDRDAAERIE